jgi:hypothetical protein
MSKVYCEDCTQFHERELERKKGIIVCEECCCKVIVDDYHSPTHTTFKSPSFLNAQNNCSLFEPKSGKQ